MNSLIQQPAPNFRCQGVMPDGSLRVLSLTEFRGKHPLLGFGELEPAIKPGLAKSREFFAASNSKHA